MLLAGLAFGFAGSVLWQPKWLHHPPLPDPPSLPPPVGPPPSLHDELAPLVELIGSTVQHTAEAVGKAVSTAQHGPVEPAPQFVKRWQMDPDIEAGIVDASDPSDTVPWLAPDRADVGFLEEGESPVPGVPWTRT